MDDLGRAGRDAGSVPRASVEDEHVSFLLPPDAEAQGTGDGEADGSRAGDDDVGFDLCRFGRRSGSSREKVEVVEREKTHDLMLAFRLVVSASLRNSYLSWTPENRKGPPKD